MRDAAGVSLKNAQERAVLVISRIRFWVPRSFKHEPYTGQSKDGCIIDRRYIALSWQLCANSHSGRRSRTRPAMLHAGMLALPLKSTEAKKVDWAAALGRYVARAYSKEHAAAHSEQFATVAA